MTQRIFMYTAGVVLFICTLFFPVLSASSDSIQYWNLRNQVKIDETNAAVAKTADALAREGLFKEALDICASMITLPGDTGEEEYSTRQDYEPNAWRVGVGVDYYNLQDFDTSQMTTEEYKDYKRLTESPLSIWTRAGYEVAMSNWYVKQLFPQVYVSNYRSTFLLPATIPVFNNRLSVEPAVKAGKWFQADASGPIQFHPFESYGSDMVGMSLRLDPQNRHTDNRQWTWRAPLVFDWEHFRGDRSGYESLIEYRFSPAAEYRTTGVIAYVFRCQTELQYEDYYRASSDSLDVIRSLVSSEGTVRTKKQYLQIRGEWLYDTYLNTSALEYINRFKADVRYNYRVNDRCIPQLMVQTVYEQERYGKTFISEGYGLSGTECTVRPTLRVILSDALYIEPEGTWEKRWAAQRYNTYVWWALSSLEGSLRAVISLKKNDLSCGVSYRWEHIDPQFYSSITDNRNINVLIDWSYSPVSFCTINALGDYQYRIYTPFNAQSRKTYNITASINGTFTW